ncbi:cyclin-domain-containing protein [Chlamydoabsidia padenii]|nr:cyclin-domain-containing protein [Chlamydoabsidia padenii]
MPAKLTTNHHVFDLVHHPIKDTIFLIKGLLEKITSTNDLLRSTHRTTCFHARTIPSIDIETYLLRILKYCPCTNECFLSLLVYFDRMARNGTHLRLDSYNIHRLIICGVMIASKFFSDVFYTNVRYAKVGGIPVKELNRLELEFLRMNDFTLNIQVEELQKYGNQLWMHHQREQADSYTQHPPLHTHRLPTPPPQASDHTSSIVKIIS